MAAQSIAGRKGKRIRKQPTPKATASASNRIRSDFIQNPMHEEMAYRQEPYLLDSKISLQSTFYGIFRRSVSKSRGFCFALFSEIMLHVMDGDTAEIR